MTLPEVMWPAACFLALMNLVVLVLLYLFIEARVRGELTRLFLEIRRKDLEMLEATRAHDVGFFFKLWEQYVGAVQAVLKEVHSPQEGEQLPPEE